MQELVAFHGDAKIKAKYLKRVRAHAKIVPLKHTLVSMRRARFNAKKFPAVAEVLAGSRAAVEQMIAAQEKGDEAAIKAARSAAWSAWSAAWSAESAAYDYYADELLSLIRKTKRGVS